MVITRKTLMYMGKSDVSREMELTPYQVDILSRYSSIMSKGQQLINGSNNYVQQAYDDMTIFLYLAKRLGLPPDDMEVIGEMVSSMVAVHDDLNNWINGDIGVEVEERENWFGLPSGSLTKGTVE